jgi:hypothetical protein
MITKELPVEFRHTYDNEGVTVEGGGNCNFGLVSHNLLITDKLQEWTRPGCASPTGFRGRFI